LGDSILTLTDEIIQIGERYYVKAVATLSDNDGSASVSAYAREAEYKKGMDAAQITGSASSYARKYALNGLFCIDDARDDDNRQPTDFKKKTPDKEEKQTSEYDKPTKKQVDLIYKKGGEYGYSDEEVENLVTWFRDGDRLTRKEASALIDKMLNDMQGLHNEYITSNAGEIFGDTRPQPEDIPQ
jgi:hypothetical protein